MRWEDILFDQDYKAEVGQNAFAPAAGFGMRPANIQQVGKPKMQPTPMPGSQAAQSSQSERPDWLKTLFGDPNRTSDVEDFDPVAFRQRRALQSGTQALLTGDGDQPLGKQLLRAGLASFAGGLGADDEIMGIERADKERQRRNDLQERQVGQTDARIEQQGSQFERQQGFREDQAGVQNARADQQFGLQSRVADANIANQAGQLALGQDRVGIARDQLGFQQQQVGLEQQRIQAQQQQAQMLAQRQAEDQAIASQESSLRKSETINTAANDVFDVLEGGIGFGLGDGVGGVEGFFGGFVPGSANRRLAPALESLKANSGFDTLQAMRDASPTGGALGAISERELSLLQAAGGSLSTEQAPEKFARNVSKFVRLQSESVYGTDARLDTAVRRGDITPQQAQQAKKIRDQQIFNIESRASSIAGVKPKFGDFERAITGGVDTSQLDTSELSTQELNQLADLLDAQNGK